MLLLIFTASVVVWVALAWVVFATPANRWVKWFCALSGIITAGIWLAVYNGWM